MTTWTDRDGTPVTAPEPPADGAFYRPVGDFQGVAYERNAFTKGTAQEVDFLWGALGLEPGITLLDVGCGTGRHCRALAARGVATIGVDLSFGLLEVGNASSQGAYVQADARCLPFEDATADVVISLCQGGFGITPGGDRRILDELARVLRPGGRLCLTAFSLVFAARWMAPEDAIDVERGLVWSPAEVRDADGATRRFDLWTSCYSAGHLQDLIAGAGFDLERISGCEPGQFGYNHPTMLHPELLVTATRKNE